MWTWIERKLEVNEHRLNQRLLSRERSQLGNCRLAHDIVICMTLYADSVQSQRLGGSNR